MAETTAPAPESMEYRTEVKQLLDILAHSLYSEREIFLRELISNASDALNRIQFEMLTNDDVLDAGAPLEIQISFDSEAKTITLRDTGIGMNREELIDNLGTIARSGAKAFLQNAEAEDASLEEIIGQFGVGFYSSFTVANEVSVTSRSYRKEDDAWTWRSSGDSAFTLEPADKEDRGTEIVITLKENASEYANAWKLEQIIRQHSDYVSFPIFVADATPQEAPEVVDAETDETDEAVEEKKPEPVNKQTALWRQSPSSVEDDDYNAFYKQLTYDFTDPLLNIHMVADMPVNVRSILFVPGSRDRGLLGPRDEHGLRLYSRKVLIENRNKDLLPEYYRFVEGVVDSEDLPLNVSREMVQSNPMMRQLKKALSGRVTREIKSLAEEEGDGYNAFWDQFGVYLKEGVATDPSSHDSLIELLRFHSSTANSADSWTSLAEYVARMGEDQTDIYYVLGDDMKSAANSPHMDYFRANELEVLYLIDPIDGFMISMLREYDEKPLRNIDDAGLDLPETPKEEDEEKAESTVSQDDFDALLERFKSTLGERVIDVRESKQLVSSPCRLVSSEDSTDRDLQRLRRLMNEETEAPQKILELNRDHTILADLAAINSQDGDDALVATAIEQLFDNALLMDGWQPNSADMVSRIHGLMEQAVAARAGQ